MQLEFDPGRIRSRSQTLGRWVGCVSPVRVLRRRRVRPTGDRPDAGPLRRGGGGAAQRTVPPAPPPVGRPPPPPVVRPRPGARDLYARVRGPLGGFSAHPSRRPVAYYFWGPPRLYCSGTRGRDAVRRGHLRIGRISTGVGRISGMDRSDHRNWDAVHEPDSFVCRNAPRYV